MANTLNMVYQTLVLQKDLFKKCIRIPILYFIEEH